MDQLDLIIDLHAQNKRQGPGSEKDTLHALNFMDLPSDRTLQVADIGCGTGGHSITLAKTLNAQITAVDLFPAFLDKLSAIATKEGLTENIHPLEASMDDLPFQEESLDMIWSEGAIYNMGFEAGIAYWRQFLKPGGYLAVSEITWITNHRPAEIESFWNSEYPEINTASAKITQLEDHGYVLCGYFFLDPSSWTETYYNPLKHSFDAFLERHEHARMASDVVKEHQSEIDQYEKYQEFFSYGFYIARKLK